MNVKKGDGACVYVGLFDDGSKLALKPCIGGIQFANIKRMLKTFVPFYWITAMELLRNKWWHTAVIINKT